MPRFVLDDETVRAIKTAAGPLELCDGKGELVAVVIKDGADSAIAVDLPPLPSERELKEILAQPRYSFEQVLEELEG